MTRFKVTIKNPLLNMALLGLFAVAFGGSGLYLLISEGRAFVLFSSVEGVVTSSHVRVEREQWGGGISGYYPDIDFRYEVNGRVYTGRYQLSHWSAIRGHEATRKIVLQYPVGTKVTGYYDPFHPSTAVISRKIHWVTWVVLAFFLVIASQLRKMYREYRLA